MKTLKTTFSKSKYVLLALIVAFSFSCSPEDGAPGPQGEQGPAGQDGLDGNANVQTFTFDLSTIGGSSFTTVNVPALTQDVVDNDAILGYITTSGSTWTALPCPADSFQFDYAVDVNIAVGSYTMDYSDGTGNNVSITVGDIQTLKIVLIESNSTTAGKVSNIKENLINQLIEAGVDIKDYYSVCDYYGIDY